MKGAIAIAAGGAALAPFTGGSSMVLSAVSATPVAAFTGIEISSIIIASAVGITLIIFFFR